MAETGIEWTATRLSDGRVFPGYTFNPWWVCDEVSPACDGCYAREWAKKFGWAWGANAPRRFFDDGHWSQPRRWNEKARKLGVRLKVFCASMADVFEILPPGHADTERLEAERQRLWKLIEETPHLDWLLLTKRPKNIERLVPAQWWAQGFPPHVWVGTTAENQEWADKRIPHLLRVPASVRFLSMEPLLGPVDVTRWLDPVGIECPDVCPGRRYVKVSEAVTGDLHHHGETECYPLCPDCGIRAQWTGYDPGVDWVIVGGESGEQARPMHPDWARSLRDQCQSAGVPYFFKQWGEWKPISEMPEAEHDALYAAVPDGVPEDLYTRPCKVPTRAIQYDGGDGYWLIDGHCGYQTFRVGKKRAGRLLDGREWNETPASVPSVPSRPLDPQEATHA